VSERCEAIRGAPSALEQINGRAKGGISRAAGKEGMSSGEETAAPSEKEAEGQEAGRGADWNRGKGGGARESPSRGLASHEKQYSGEEKFSKHKKGTQRENAWKEHEEKKRRRTQRSGERA